MSAGAATGRAGALAVMLKRLPPGAVAVCCTSGTDPLLYLVIRQRGATGRAGALGVLLVRLRPGAGPAGAAPALDVIQCRATGRADVLGVMLGRLPPDAVAHPRH